MTDLSRDPIVNTVHGGIKRGIRVALENNCLGAAATLILCGMDAMAYLDMPEAQQDVTRTDFIRWADCYIRFPCKEQLAGIDLYGARCAVLHQYGSVSALSRDGKCRLIGYMDRSIPEVRYDPSVSKELVLVSVQALAEAFFAGVDRFLVDIFSDREKARVAELRFKKMLQTIPTEKGSESAGAV